MHESNVPHPNASSAAGAAHEAAKDPVCGMNVDPKSAVRHEHGGKTYYFCSAHCKEKFRTEPQKYEAK